ncbi:hypothetical protein [Tenacibaculum sp. nBUS_03]|uniref:hypothetical protein n=1 Tax=Tenacibaculum sp. nBUS_03 TaxID=3395320 RepID=UPI003EB6A98A
MHQIKASSLAESVLSLALVSIAVFISMVIFSNLFASFQSRVIRIDTLSKIDSIKIEIEKSPSGYLGRNSVNIGDLTIRTYGTEKNEDLVLLKISAEKNGNIFIDKNYLVIYEKK